MPTDIDSQHRRLAEILARALRAWQERHADKSADQAKKRASVPASAE